jgi:hypothetical protein
MNKILWKLDHIGERLWILATMAFTQASLLENEGKGIAVVAEETRKMGNHVSAVVEKSMVDGEELNVKVIKELAFHLNLLALNCAIESSRIIGSKGKQAAVLADDIRSLAYEIVCLFDDEGATKKKHMVSPWAANPSSVAKNGEFLLLDIGGIQFTESLTNIKEITGPIVERIEIGGKNNIILRNMEIPLIDGYKMLGKTKEVQTYVIMWTPWAEQNKTYAVAADVSCLFFSPIGQLVDTPPKMPLAGYVRECWENEHGQPFYFMDWTKMV